MFWFQQLCWWMWLLWMEPNANQDGSFTLMLTPQVWLTSLAFHFVEWVVRVVLLLSQDQMWMFRPPASISFDDVMLLLSLVLFWMEVFTDPDDSSLLLSLQRHGSDDMHLIQFNESWVRCCCWLKVWFVSLDPSLHACHWMLLTQKMQGIPSRNVFLQGIHHLRGTLGGTQERREWAQEHAKKILKEFLQEFLLLQIFDFRFLEIPSCWEIP